MLGLFLSAFQLLSLVTGNPLNSGRYLVDSQPIMFLEESESDSQVINSTLVLKKKENSGGPVYYTDNRQEDIINNHHIDAEGVVWKRPYRPVTDVFSNHKGTLNWSRKSLYKATTTTEPPQTTTTTQVTTKQAPKPAEKPVNRLPAKQVIVNNHNPSSPVKSRPHRPSSVITVVNPPPSTPTDIIGDRLKAPDTIKSATIKVLDAPSHLKTTIKHNKIIVIQKRVDQQLPITTVQAPITTVQSPITTVQSQPITTAQLPITVQKVTSAASTSTLTETTSTSFNPTEIPDMGNFSVAPVMDMWSNIPIPSKPAWASSSSQPVKGGVSRPTVAHSPIVPHTPFMSFMTTLLSPLINRPLSSSAVNSGMQGIKAMQGFLRNSLMGAMFCFLPSAFIALSLTATQRAQLRKIPEIDDMMIFCKKCLENLKEIKEMANSKELTWMNETS